jgi:DNA excision repair protein ERCC-2
LKISVRNLVEFVYRSGDISFEFSGTSRNLAGIKGHQKIQKSRGAGYQAEVTLEHSFILDGMTISVGGRIDGLWETEDGLVLEEIKTTTLPLEEILADSFFLHWAQVRTYAFIYMNNEGLEQIDIQLTYFNIDNKKTKEFRRAISCEEAKAYFAELIKLYLSFARTIENRKKIRDLSAASLTFPFPEYRPGQRSLAVEVYKTIDKSERFFFQAATGIGKTAAVIFPAVKALGRELSDKVFYLTAKTMGKSIAEQCLGLLMKQGLNSLTVTITAKEKICFEPDAACHPDECKYAKGYYDRLREAVREGLEQDLVTRQKIVELSQKHRICPFEFTLDLALWADFIICDYNYAFDPRVYLRRFFQEQQDSYTFLIDEAHNLVDRSREMHSAELFKKEYLVLRKKIRDVSASFAKHLTKLNNYFLSLKKELEAAAQEAIVLKEIPEELIGLLRKFCYTAEPLLVKDVCGENKEELLKLYFETSAFLRISELFDQHFVFYYDKRGKNDVRIKIFCLDPSQLMKENLKKAKAAVFFSATMTPLSYFIELLGGEEEDRRIVVNSPFPQENRAVIICPQIVTLYKKRTETRQELVEYLKAALSAKKGNYLVYFSSYQYMNQVLEVYSRGEDREMFLKIVQKQDMTEEAREEFLRQFHNRKERNTLGFAVLGGVFGEGIDLLGESLIGALIVGVGLPQISLEQELIKDFFQEKNSRGFDYAYRFPGMNRILQAAGRVIRSEKDKGVIILFDKRFSYRNYKELFPQEWQHCLFVNSPAFLKTILQQFWGEKTPETRD